jgi:competence protein ComEA
MKGMFIMLDWLKANKMYLLLGVLIAAALAIYYFMPVHAKNEKNNAMEWEDSSELLLQEEKLETAQKEAEEKETMVVDVKGAVVKPGVYEAQTGDRVIDIIHLAGGLLENADQNQINFAMKVADEMVLYLPVIGEEDHHNSEGTAPNFGSFTASTSDNGKVNLNRASESELQTLTGVGPSKAAAIIEYRDTNGPFKEIEQLKEISGIGDKTFEKLKEEITVR